MLILGATSDVSRSFVDQALQSKDAPNNITLISSNPDETAKLAQHFQVKYQKEVKVFPLDLTQPNSDLSFIDQIEFTDVFCAIGYLGKDTENGWTDAANTKRILDINYSNLVPVLDKIAQKMLENKKGTMVVLSSVAGERGRQSNFIYGSAKAGITTYLSGLRNYLTPKGIHVLTVKPGFMATKMTEGMDLPAPLTATPEQAAKAIFKAYKKKKNVIYVLWMWRWIMCIIRNIPEFIFKKMKL